jgi:hypothetical protein
VTAGDWRKREATQERQQPRQQVAGGSKCNSRTATTADILAAEYQLPRSADRHKTMLELLLVSLQVISVSFLLPAVFILQVGWQYEDILAEAVCSALIYFSVMLHKCASVDKDVSISACIHTQVLLLQHGFLVPSPNLWSKVFTHLSYGLFHRKKF